MKEFTKKILFQLNLLVAFAMLLAYGANHVSPAKVWLIAFFGLAYPYLLAINTFFLVFWVWRVNKFALLSLIVIFIGFGNVGRYIQLNSSNTEQTASNISVLTFNVRVFDNYNWYGKEINRDTIAAYINTHNSDIICLQEFFIDERIHEKSEKYTKKLFAQNPNAHVNFTRNPDGTTRRFGVATFSKYPIIERGSIKFDQSFNTCIYSDMLIDSDTIRVYNLHLQSISLKKDYTLMDSLTHLNSKRIDEVKDISKRLKTAFIRRAQQVDAVKEHVDASPYPVILCGDFNDTPVSYTYHQILGDKKDTFREAGSGVIKTYRGNLPSYRIDYIMHDDIFEALSYSVPRVKLSDHYPVVSTLQMNSNTQE